MEENKNVISRVMQKNSFGELEYLTFPAITDTDMVNHLFSTRLGGVSEGCLGTMNLSYARGDKKENVDENYRRIARALGRRVEEFVMTDQTHTVNVMNVRRRDAGKGIIYEKDYKDIDGLITNRKGVVLGALFADCVPLFFVDTKRGAIGLAHAGWRGTADKMAAVMVRQMHAAFQTKPEDLIVGIGPCICQNCYEVSEEVMLRYMTIFGRMIVYGKTCSELMEDVYHKNENGRYQLDLSLANYYILLSEGVKADNISIADVCTCCNNQYLFSHRASKGRRGNLGAFLAMK